MYKPREIQDMVIALETNLQLLPNTQEAWLTIADACVQIAKAARKQARLLATDERFYLQRTGQKLNVR